MEGVDDLTEDDVSSDLMEKLTSRIAVESNRFWKTLSCSGEEEEARAVLSGKKNVRYGSVARRYESAGSMTVIPAVDSSKARLRIEVMHSWEMNAVVLALYAAILLGVLYTVAFGCWIRRDWRGEQDVLEIRLGGMAENENIAVRTVHWGARALAAGYTVRVVLLRHSERLDEQIWACVLLAACLVGKSPFDTSPGLWDYALDKSLLIDPPSDQWWRQVRWSCLFDDALFSALTYFYFLSSVHSYRILPEAPKRGENFYSPKVAITSIYFVVKVALGLFGSVRMGFLPFTQLIGVVFLQTSGRQCLGSFASIIAISLFDAYLVSWVIKEVAKTTVFLAKQRYLESRTKQLGFRSFVYLNICFGISMLIASTILCLLTPKELYFVFVDAWKSRSEVAEASLLQLSPIVGQFGLSLMHTMWLALTSYLNLPPRGPPFSHERKEEHTDLANQTDYPLVYRDKELRTDEHDSSSPLALRKNEFVMETQILMINCAWISYIPNNPREEKHGDEEEFYKGRRKVRLMDVLRHTNLSLHRYIHDPRTDAHALILEAYDRVIVSFSGTRSYKNWIHNIEIYRSRWSQHFSRFIGEEESDELADVEDDFLVVALAKELIHFGEEKVHSGFARIYKRLRPQLMRSLMDLYGGLADHERERAAWKPLFFTGHSLGGALATLASFDAAINYYKIGLRAQDDVSCTTFGSPRVGNTAFRNLYSDKVAHHWRFVVASDLVTKMPRWTNYAHVGTQVLLDYGGNLLVDPSFIELNWWHHIYSSVKFHSRYCYFISMKLWCRNYSYRSEELQAKFWNLPGNPHLRKLLHISDDDIDLSP